MVTLTELLKLLPIITGFIFALLFILYIKKQKSFIYLLLNIIFNTLGITTEYLSFSGNLNIAEFTYYFVAVFLLFPAPFLYYYVLSLVKIDFRITKYNILHIVIPFVLSVVSAVLFYLIPENTKLDLVSGNIHNISNESGIKTPLFFKLV